MKSSLLSLYPSATSAELTLSGGSITVSVRLIFGSAAAANLAASSLASATVASLSTSLSVSVLSKTAPAVLVVAVTEPVVCCAAMTASCLACGTGQTLQEYCALHPSTAGCTVVPESGAPTAHLIHGLLMTTAFALLFPTAAFTPRFWKAAAPKHWMLIHKSLNALAIAFTVAGSIVGGAKISADGGTHFSGLHKILGLILTILVLFQGLNGLLRPPKVEDDDKGAPPSAVSKRRNWKWLHGLLGYGVLILAIVQLITGVRLSYSLEFLYGLHGGLLGLAAVWAIVGFVLSRSAGGDEPALKMAGAA